ncbi:SdpI family protein [Nocardioides sp. TRM66260-LWL]|uniref:SdpI family protein n=1 Tax=Nocardioides sp. TRM66260-LWL TaxID=2874478 RepID=UPI001CC395A2|nr:SdpI family protein [Nocardioides sp. TRM66260-LWL]MBZ5734110.1 SdpI family protein [Nocardioides sp. TRM66260-LWL]
MDALLAACAPIGLMIGLVDVALARSIAVGLPRNRLVGIRLPGLLRSDAAWDAGHRAAAPVLARTGALALAVTAIGLLACLPLLPDAIRWIGAGLVATGAAIALGGVAVGSLRAARAARRVP